MHDGNWDQNWAGGSWWWMAIMMIAFWAGVIWIGVVTIRHRNRQQQATPASQVILEERLARGEIDPDEYLQRLDTLQHQQRG
jgi:putative membrane protein